MDRKYWVTALVRCKSCSLLYRTPTTTSEENEAYYQSEYQLGFTTEMPEPAELERLKRERFAGSEKDFIERIAILKALGVQPGCKLLDFGCSWGYGSWQLVEASFRVDAFEISKARCAYARDRLGIRATSDLGDLGCDYDVFFSSHVLEHVPDPADTIRFALERLRPGGLFVAFTPNGSLQRRAVDERAWHLAWGLDHPNLLDEVFYGKCLGNLDQLFLSTPFPAEALREFAEGRSFVTRPLTGSELLAVARTAR